MGVYTALSSAFLCNMLCGSRTWVLWAFLLIDRYCFWKILQGSDFSCFLPVTWSRFCVRSFNARLTVGMERNMKSIVLYRRQSWSWFEWFYTWCWLIIIAGMIILSCVHFCPVFRVYVLRTGRCSAQNKSAAFLVHVRSWHWWFLWHYLMIL